MLSLRGLASLPRKLFARRGFDVSNKLTVYGAVNTEKTAAMSKREDFGSNAC